MLTQGSKRDSIPPFKFLGNSFLGLFFIILFLSLRRTHPSCFFKKKKALMFYQNWWHWSCLVATRQFCFFKSMFLIGTPNILKTLRGKSCSYVQSKTMLSSGFDDWNKAWWECTHLCCDVSMWTLSDQIRQCDSNWTNVRVASPSLPAVVCADNNILCYWFELNKSKQILHIIKGG